MFTRFLIPGLFLFGLGACASNTPRERVSKASSSSSSSSSSSTSPSPSSIPSSALQQAGRLKVELSEIQSILRKQERQIRYTEEGIPYLVWAQGAGAAVAEGHTAVFYGTIRALSGALLYDYRQAPLTVPLMRHPWPSAMQKVWLGMRVGERREVFLPASYAYGLSGDGDKIGSHCSIIINFRLEAFR